MTAQNLLLQCCGSTVESNQLVQNASLRLQGSGSYLQTDGMGTTLQNASWSGDQTINFARIPFLNTLALGKFSLAKLGCAICPGALGVLGGTLSTDGAPAASGPVGTQTEAVSGATWNIAFSFSASLDDASWQGCGTGDLVIGFTAFVGATLTTGGVQTGVLGDPASGGPNSIALTGIAGALDKRGTYVGHFDYVPTPTSTLTIEFHLTWTLELS